MGTANHYFLDAVAGAAVMGAGLLLTPLRAADRGPGGSRSGSTVRRPVRGVTAAQDRLLRGARPVPNCQWWMPDFRG